MLDTLSGRGAVTREPLARDLSGPEEAIPAPPCLFVIFGSDEVRDEQAKVLRAVQPLAPEDVLSRTVRGQYGEGSMAEGRKVPGYRAEPRIAADSRTETYVALRLQIDSWRWAGGPSTSAPASGCPGAGPRS
jgi:glucose-6-phosphate 1-dehydrogenase